MNKRPVFLLSYSLCAFCFLFSGVFCYAQQVPVTFRFVNEKKQPVPFTTVTATDRSDSLHNMTQLADSSGVAILVLKKSSQYKITATAIGYQPAEKGITVETQTNFLIQLEAAAKTLGGVVVRSSRPLMRQEDDKTIVDPENLAQSSTSGYEIIEKTPGLFVDQDGNIYISSTTPASVYINGREMKMSAADIATMLKSLPPNSIASIEIMRTPSAKYDASGSGGIVNVVLKKGVKIGLTGSVNLGWQQGNYGNQFIGVNLNNNNGRNTSYINLNYSKRNSYERIKTDRLFAADTILNQDAYTTYPSDNYYLGYGVARELTDKWELSYDGRLSLNKFNNNTDNNSIIRKISTGNIITDNLARVNNQGSGSMINQGINAKYKIDSAGSEWTTDLSYTYSRNNTDQSYTTVFKAPVFPAVGGDGNSLNKRDFFSAQSDLAWKLPRKFTVETGIKTTLLQYNSVTGYFKEAGGTRVKDNARTNTFDYKENISSLYLQGSKNISGVIIKAGGRVENTYMKGHQLIPSDTTFFIRRTDFFPYVYISKDLMKIAGYELRAYLVYRRTISRPVYEQLNPFPRYVDQYLSEAGNPTLRPQFTQNYEANISVDERPIVAVGYNDTKDIFTNVIYQADSTRSQAYRTYDNLGSNKELYVRALGAIPPGGRYFFVLGTQYNHNFYQGLYENQPLSFKRGTWTFFTYQTFKIDKLSQITLNGFVRFKGQQQLYELGSFGQLNTSINRQLFRKKVLLTLSMNDIFFTSRNNFVINQGSVNASGFRQADTRRFGINLRYNFGVRKKEDAQNMFNIETP